MTTRRPPRPGPRATAHRLAATARAGLSLGHPVGRFLVLRDSTAFLRIEVLGALARAGLAGPLAAGGTPVELAARAGCTDVALTTALLDLAVAQRLVRRRGGTYRARGARLRAVASERAPDISGLVEDAAAYTGRIYAALPDHLRGAPPGPYDVGLGEAIARVSRLVEPVVGPWLEAAVRSVGARRVLDVGCGSGVNLRWIARALPPDGVAVGIDRDPEVAASAGALLAAAGLADRVRAEAADLDALPDELAAEPWDVVLLAQNVYYWPVAERVALLQKARQLTGGSGTVLVLTAVPGANPIARNLDVVLRVTAGCSRLPTRGELAADARAAGFSAVRVADVVPGAGLAVLHASG